MSSDSQWLLIGAVIGVVGAVLGGVVGGYVQGLAWYHFERKRALAEKRDHDLRQVLEWAKRGRVENLRNMMLDEADLRGVDLGPAPDEMQGLFAELRERGADLSYSSFRKANLAGANLAGALLIGVDMSEARFSEIGQYTGQSAKMRRAQFSGAKLDRANLSWVDLRNCLKRSLAG